jgi:hypothetical protein
MDTPALVTLIGSTASAGATVLLTGLTAWYVRLTHSLVQEARAAKRPNVFVDLEFDSSDVKFLVGNTGASPAFNVRLAVADSIPWRKVGETTTGISELSIVRDGIKYLAPGRTLKFNAGYVDHSPEFFATGSEVEVVLTYEADNGVTMTQTATINLQSYAGVLFESFIHPEREVAMAIRDAERDRSLHEHTKGMAGRLFRTYCPSCRKKISPKAKKCPHCLEFVKLRRRRDA